MSAAVRRTTERPLAYGVSPFGGGGGGGGVQPERLLFERLLLERLLFERLLFERLPPEWPEWPEWPL